MNIQIVSGVGTGPTKLSAFDSALGEAGVSNYNLIKLSSVIPLGAKVKVSSRPIDTQPGNWGDRLYVVMADTRVDTPNVEAWAGIGWVQNKKSGQGLFVEHEGANKSTVRRDIQASLEALQTTRNLNFGPVNMKVVGITCIQKPVCAVVMAIFQASGWKSDIRPKVRGLHK
ncbi:MAG: pyruvoyl-dependent arginine decarboxylase [Candidatus Saccharimonadales bacterium]|jgi:arginine decarboxylase